MILDPRTFESWSFSVELGNPLSGEPLAPPPNFKKKDPKAPQTSKSPGADLIEINGKELVLDAPGRIYPQGHHVLLTIFATDSGRSRKRLRFSSTARIDKLEPHAGDRARLGLTLMQYDNKSWKELCTALAERQDEIIGFLKEVRGV